MCVHTAAMCPPSPLSDTNTTRSCLLACCVPRPYLMVLLMRYTSTPTSSTTLSMRTTRWRRGSARRLRMFRRASTIVREPHACTHASHPRNRMPHTLLSTHTHTGSINGTTLAISKRGSGLSDVLNPCIKAVSQTQEYTALCESHFNPSSCIQNAYSSSSGPSSYHYDNRMNARTDSYTCTDGYCTCS